jgi:uncharacterized protein (TIGR03435 family)
MLMLLHGAYPEFEKPGMIVGGPGWLSERRFDIEAKAAGSPTPQQYEVMVRRLLADRFKLKVRVERRPVEVYWLLVARSDGRLGPRLRPATPQCLAELKAEEKRVESLGDDVVFTSGDPQPCNGGFTPSSVAANKLLRLAGGERLESIAIGLEVFMDKRVVDRTGLKGIYEYELEFDYGSLRSTDVTGRSEVAGTSVFTAVQEQLGLKLERRRETTNVLVINSVEMPSEN